MIKSSSSSSSSEDSDSDDDILAVRPRGKSVPTPGVEPGPPG